MIFAKIATRKPRRKNCQSKIVKTLKEDVTNRQIDLENQILYRKLDDGAYNCDICQAIFTQKCKILRHIATKHSFNRPFKCSICPKSFKYKCDLKIHEFVHDKFDPRALHHCEMCDYSTPTKNNLRSHCTRKHTNDYKYSCEHCGKSFKMIWDLKFHLGTHGNYQQMCDVCGRFYTSKYSLDKHQKVSHINNYAYHCEICRKKLLTRKNLDSHMLQHKCNYDCDICGKVFSSKRYLATHVTIHNDHKPYSCDICEKKFRTSHTRNTHLLTHSSDKPHVCDICGKSFKRRYCMIEHRRKHPDSHLSSPSIPLGKNNCANGNS